MNIKDFFTPTRWKVFTAVLMYLFLKVIGAFIGFTSYALAVEENMAGATIAGILYVIANPGYWFFMMSPPLGVIIQFFYAYALACFVMYVISRVKGISKRESLSKRIKRSAEKVMKNGITKQPVKAVGIFRPTKSKIFSAIIVMIGFFFTGVELFSVFGNGRFISYVSALFELGFFFSISMFALLTKEEFIRLQSFIIFVSFLAQFVYTYFIVCVFSYISARLGNRERTIH